MKIILKKFLIFLSILIGSILLGYILLVGAYSLPLEPIQKNLSKSAYILASEGIAREIIPDYTPSMCDNWTEACMLLIAGHEPEASPFVEALENNLEDGVEGGMSVYVLADKYSEKGLRDAGTWSYGRYWHGYLIFLKPLLMIFSYAKIRVIIGALQLLLVAAVISVLAYKRRTKMIIPVIVTYIFLCPAAMSVSMQYDHIFSVTFIQILLFTVFEKFYMNRSNWIYHFFAAGIITSYFDLLTTPMVTFGVPFVFLFVMYGSRENGFWSKILDIIKSGVAWVAGFGLFWLSKILIGTAVTGIDYLQDAAGRTSAWSAVGGDAVTSMSTPEMFAAALQKILNAVNIWLPLLALILLAALIIMKKNRQTVFTGVCLALCACLPLLWYIVLSSHSYIHTHFALRNLSISVMAITAFFAASLESRAESKRLKS